MWKPRVGDGRGGPLGGTERWWVRRYGASGREAGVRRMAGVFEEERSRKALRSGVAVLPRVGGRAAMTARGCVGRRRSEGSCEVGMEGQPTQ